MYRSSARYRVLRRVELMTTRDLFLLVLSAVLFGSPSDGDMLVLLLASDGPGRRLHSAVSLERPPKNRQPVRPAPSTM